MTSDGWDALKSTSSDELIALSSIGGVTDPDLDNVCTDMRARTFVNTFKPVSHEGTVLAPPRPPDEPDDPFADALDFSQVHADDEFLDALGAAQPDPDGTFANDKLTALLQSWRHDVDTEPIHELVDPKLAVTTVQAARIRQRRGSRLLAPLAAAAAILAIVFAGVGLAARDAEPGDTLWGLTRVLYTDHARSVEAAAQVRADLEEAEKALAASRPADAKDPVGRAQTALSNVADEDGKVELETRYAQLVAKLESATASGR